MKKVLVWIGIALLAAGSVAVRAAEKREVNSILASVNGEAITLMDVLPLTMSRENQLRSIYSGSLLKKEIHALRKKCVDNLIDSKLLQAEYAKQSFRIANRDIERELDRIAENMGCRSREEFLRKLRQDGLSLEEIRREVEKNMMVQVMIQRQIVIDGAPTPAEIYEYFIAHKNDYAGEEKIGLAMLKLDVSRPDLKEVSAEIEKALKADSNAFDAMMKKYASGSGSGNLGEIERSLLRPEFSTALKNISLGCVVGPLQIDGGVVWLKVISYQPAAEAEFKSVEAQIKRDLEKKRREQLLGKYFKKLREKAVIEYYF